MNQAEIFWSISLLRSTPCWCQPFGSGEPQHGWLCVDLSSNSHLNSLFFGDASVSHMFQNHLIRVRCDLLSLRDPFGYQATSGVRFPPKNNFFYFQTIITTHRYINNLQHVCPQLIFFFVFSFSRTLFIIFWILNRKYEFIFEYSTTGAGLELFT